MLGVVLVPRPDVVGVGASVSVYMIAVSGQEAPPAVVGYHTVHGPYLYGDQAYDCYECKDDLGCLILCQRIICAIVIKGCIGDGGAAGEGVLPVAHIHQHIAAAVQSTAPGVIAILPLGTGCGLDLSVLRPAEGIVLHRGCIEPAGDKGKEIAVFVLAEHAF